MGNGDDLAQFVSLWQEMTFFFPFVGESRQRNVFDAANTPV